MVELRCGYFGSIQSIRSSTTYFLAPYRIVCIMDPVYDISGVPTIIEVLSEMLSSHNEGIALTADDHEEI